jgi:hypothetical protein
VGEYTVNTSLIALDIHYTANRVPPTGTTLDIVVRDLCLESPELDDTNIDVTELSVFPVRGYKTAQQEVRAAIRELMDVYPFDGCESDGKLKFKRKDGSSAFTIPEDDIVLNGDADKGYRLAEPLTQEDELPMRYQVKYPDIDRDFQDNEQYSKRIVEPQPTMGSITTKSVSTNVVFNANEAVQAANIRLWEEWANHRGAQLQPLPKHILKDPCDVGIVSYRNQSIPIRLTEANVGAGLGLDISAISHDPDVYSSTILGSDGFLPPPFIPPTPPEDSPFVIFVDGVPISRDYVATIDLVNGPYIITGAGA